MHQLCACCRYRGLDFHRAIRVSYRIGVTNSFDFMEMMDDGEDGGVDVVDKNMRLPSLGFILLLLLFTIMLLTILIGETVFWFRGIAYLVRVQWSPHKRYPGFCYRVIRRVCIIYMFN